MNNQDYQKLIERLSKNLIKIITTFLIIPFLLILVTPLVYWQALLTTILTITIYKQIKKYVGKR
jgi:hypothetical protein